MTHLYLVRHGETDWNAARRIQGMTDIPLNDTGRAQALSTAKLLSALPIDGVVSSPLSRALETARIIATELGLPQPKIRDTMVERNYGQAEGLDYVTLERRFPEGSHVPGRESREQVTARILPALVELAEERAGESLVVTTHGGVIRAAVNAVSPEPHRFVGVRIPNGSIHSFRYVDGELQLVPFDEESSALSAATAATTSGCGEAAPRSTGAADRPTRPS